MGCTASKNVAKDSNRKPENNKKEDSPKKDSENKKKDSPKKEAEHGKEISPSRTTLTSTRSTMIPTNTRETTPTSTRSTMIPTSTNAAAAIRATKRRSAAAATRVTRSPTEHFDSLSPRL